MKIPHTTKYRKKIKSFNGLDVYHSESVIPFSTAAECYNFDFSSGALRDGYGVISHKYVPAESRRYIVYRYYSNAINGYAEQYIFQLSNGLLRFYDSVAGGPGYISGRVYSPINAISYKLRSKDVMLISSEGHGLIVWDGNHLTEYASSPKISSMALHYERLFVTSDEYPTKVFFSENLDPTNWDISANGAGFIELPDERGKLNKVVSFGSYLYIFRDYGISRVTAFGDQTEFSAVNLFVTAGRIYPESVATCGDVIIFLASDGLYKFDGFECVRILSSLEGLIVSPAVASAYFDGRYYLSCGIRADGEPVGCENGTYNTNGLIVYQVATGAYSVTRGVDINYFYVGSYGGEDFLMCCDGGTGGVVARCGSRFGEPLKKHWRSAEYDFSVPDRNKSIREVYIKTSTPIKLEIKNGEKTKILPVRAGDRRVRVNFSARRAAIAIDADGCGTDISPPTVVYSA